MNNPKNTAITALCLANIVWGSTFVVVKESVAQVDTFVISAFRCLSAAIVLGAYIYWKDRSVFKSQIDIKNGFVLGLILASIYVSQAFALNFTSSAHSAFITVSSTILTPVVLVMFFKTKETAKGWLFILLSFVGIYLLTFKPGSSEINSDIVFGDLITFAAALVCALQLIYSGKFVQKGSFLALIFYQFLFGGLLSLAGSFLSPSAVWSFPNDSIYYLLYLGLLGTLYCYFVTVWAQKFVSTIATAMIFAMEPIFAGTFSYLWFGEELGVKELTGATLILISVIFYQIKDKIRSPFSKA